MSEERQLGLRRCDKTHGIPPLWHALHQAHLAGALDGDVKVARVARVNRGHDAIVARLLLQRVRLLQGVVRRETA